MDQRVGAVEQAADGDRVAHVPLHHGHRAETHAEPAQHHLGLAAAAHEQPGLVTGLEQADDRVRSDEAGSSGERDVHRLSLRGGTRPAPAGRQ